MNATEILLSSRVPQQASLDALPGTASNDDVDFAVMLQDMGETEHEGDREGSIVAPEMAAVDLPASHNAWFFLPDVEAASAEPAAQSISPRELGGQRDGLIDADDDLADLRSTIAAMSETALETSPLLADHTAVAPANPADPLALLPPAIAPNRGANHNVAQVEAASLVVSASPSPKPQTEVDVGRLTSSQHVETKTTTEGHRSSETSKHITTPSTDEERMGFADAAVASPPPTVSVNKTASPSNADLSASELSEGIKKAPSVNQIAGPMKPSAPRLDLRAPTQQSSEEITERASPPPSMSGSPPKHEAKASVADGAQVLHAAPDAKPEGPIAPFKTGPAIHVPERHLAQTPDHLHTPRFADWGRVEDQPNDSPTTTRHAIKVTSDEAPAQGEIGAPMRDLTDIPEPHPSELANGSPKSDDPPDLSQIAKEPPPLQAASPVTVAVGSPAEIFTALSATSTSGPPGHILEATVAPSRVIGEAASLGALNLESSLQSATDPFDVSPPKVAKAIDDIIVAQQSRKFPVEIALDPPELGMVTIAVAGDDAEVRYLVIAERPETLELLRRNLGLLQENFGEKVTVHVQLGNTNGGEQGGQPDHGESFPDGAQPASLNEDGTERSSTVAKAHPIAKLGSGGLDLRL